MSEFALHEFESDADRTPLPRNKLSSNGQWIFGSVFAGMLLVGFSFGVWAGARGSKPAEVVEVVKKEPERAPVVTPPPVVKPPVAPPVVEPKPKDNTPPVVEPKPKEPEPKPKEPEPKPKEPEPKPKEPEPKKVEFKAVSFKEIEPIFRSYCNNCHGSVGKPKGGVDLRTIAAIMKGKDGEAIVKVGDPEKSLLYQTMKPPTATMPPDGKQGLNEKELKLVYDWIGSGAKPRRTVRRRKR